MEPIDVLNSKSVKNLLVINISFAVFACVFAALVLHFNGGLKTTNIFILICCLASFPLIVFLVSFYFAKKCYKKLYEFSVTKYHKENARLLESKIIDLVKAMNSEKAIDLAKVMDPNLKKTVEEIQKLSKEILEQFSKKVKEISNLM